MVVMVIVLGPLLPGLAHAISKTTVHIPDGLVHLYSMSWLYGFHVSIFIYWLLNFISPAEATFVSATVSAFPEDSEVLEGMEYGTRSPTNSAQEHNEIAEEKATGRE
jgi:nucleobase:cation symporter-1, NCS1 family